MAGQELLTTNYPNININIKIDGNDLIIDNLIFQKMKFVYNAINDGWSVKKRNDKYIFAKKHNYLFDFVNTNLHVNVNMNKLLD